MRHALAPTSRAFDTESAAGAMTALHATEAATVHLSLFARVHDLEVDDVERALYSDRSLVKLVAMRRTLFALPRDLLPAAWASAAARTAKAERGRLLKDVVASGIADDAECWLADIRERVLGLLADGVPRSARSLRDELPELDARVTRGSGRWAAEVPVAGPLLTVLGTTGDLLRGPNLGSWWQPRPSWTTTHAWLQESAPEWDAETGYAELVRRWLWTFGPGTEDDVVWWLGATRTAVRRALAQVRAVEVRLDSGAEGWVLPDDLDRVSEVEPSAALLPVLDPTTMGWRHRDFYLAAEHTPYLFDSNGNAGTTAWWDGRIVGCWVQDDEGVVHVVLREDVGSDGAAALDAEAERLSAWLGGVRITNVYASRQMKAARLP